MWGYLDRFGLRGDLDIGIGRGQRHKPTGEQPRVYEELMVLVRVGPKLGQIVRGDVRACNT